MHPEMQHFRTSEYVTRRSGENNIRNQLAWILLHSRHSALARDPQKTKYTVDAKYSLEQGHAFVRGQSIDCPLACPPDFLDGSAQHCASKNSPLEKRPPPRFKLLTHRARILYLQFPTEFRAYLAFRHNFSKRKNV